MMDSQWTLDMQLLLGFYNLWLAAAKDGHVEISSQAQRISETLLDDLMPVCHPEEEVLADHGEP